MKDMQFRNNSLKKTLKKIMFLKDLVFLFQENALNIVWILLF